MKSGDRVWWWDRKKGTKPYKRFGVLLQTNGIWARVRIDRVMFKMKIPVVTIQLKRLQSEET